MPISNWWFQSQEINAILSIVREMQMRQLRITAAVAASILLIGLSLNAEARSFTCPAALPVLSNPQNPVTYGADPTCTSDSTNAFQQAENQGDILVPNGCFIVNGLVGMGSGRKLVCSNTSLPPTTANATSIIRNTSQIGSSTNNFDYNGANGGEVYGCEFEGQHYPNRTWTGDTSAGATGSAVLIVNGASNITVDYNGFDDWAGSTGAVLVYAAYAQWSVGQYPQHIRIVHNRFEATNVRGIEPDAGTDILIQNNNFTASSLLGEIQDYRVNNFQLTIDHNNFHWPYNNAANFQSSHYGDEGYGAACHGTGTAAQCGFNGCCAPGQVANYSRCSFTNNNIDGSNGLSNWLWTNANPCGGGLNCILPGYNGGPGTGNNACGGSCIQKGGDGETAVAP